MKINRKILDEIHAHKSSFIAVTKYFSPEETNTIFEQLKSHKNCVGLGENRIESIQNKKIPRNFCHFIGNIQSRKIPEISQHCSVVHSLDSIKHAEKFSQEKNPPKVFLQVNISNEPQKGGIEAKNLEAFVQKMPKNLIVLGLSAIGENTDDPEKKSQEFLTLISLRDDLNPDWKISAGTSIDYQIALKHKTDILRIGRALFYS